MSGCSSRERCPRCGEVALETYVDWKPCDYTHAHCLACGWYMEPKVGLMGKKQLAVWRKEEGYEGKDRSKEKLGKAEEVF